MAKKNKVYVCCHGEDKKGRCGYNGGVELRRELKKFVEDQGLNFKVKKSQCLGKCSRCVAVQVSKEKPHRIKNVEEAIELLENFRQAL